jgi:imidazoleglycerol-phosphate dehydratase
MRTSEVFRKTLETDIRVNLSLDGGEVDVGTGVGFFDHMLKALATHAGFGLSLTCRGDLEVDCHHTVEDTGLALGEAFSKCIGAKTGIARFGSFFVPMDESLVLAAADLSGRPFLVFDVNLPTPAVGDFDTQTAIEFFRAFAQNAGVTLHIKLFHGANAHHILEAAFKAVGHALRQAVLLTDGGILSTKGRLD